MDAAYKTGPRNLITDVAGLRVGNAQDDHIKTGTTVVIADAPFTASVHVMGGLAGLQLGPAARNLFGGREAALRITRALAKA